MTTEWKQVSFLIASRDLSARMRGAPRAVNVPRTTHDGNGRPETSLHPSSAQSPSSRPGLGGTRILGLLDYESQIPGDAGAPALQGTAPRPPETHLSSASTLVSIMLGRPHTAFQTFP